MRSIRELAPFVALMVVIVAASNVLVQYPLHATLAGIDLANILTWGAFTYPVAFLITDLTNRRFGVRAARIVVCCGFVIAVAVSVELAAPRIAAASGAAFLAGQLLDVTVFNRLRRMQWWLAPLSSTVIGSIVDTTIFFGVAFAPFFAFVGANDPFAIASAPAFGFLPFEVPRYVSWAAGDLSVKLIVGLGMLVPYGLLLAVMKPDRRALEGSAA
ncbi:queuosine precursor transporter [Pararhizobium mangrovi]|uniref:Probable queuosine precursor transporter n=1 Tax=Pararhizobium mangrovi TaxID=2590452 RepID=A0A506TZ02_9HYPH|nr:queuosine precursor transporter [Pararhizobium mangrovi]TPW27312.1 queuosine precursor transporter [Pararhizobium mangrovi]